MNYCYTTLLMKVCEVGCRYDNTAQASIGFSLHLSECVCDLEEDVSPRVTVTARGMELNVLLRRASLCGNSN